MTRPIKGIGARMREAKAKALADKINQEHHNIVAEPVEAKHDYWLVKVTHHPGTRSACTLTASSIQGWEEICKMWSLIDEIA